MLSALTYFKSFTVCPEPLFVIINLKHNKKKYQLSIHYITYNKVQSQPYICDKFGGGFLFGANKLFHQDLIVITKVNHFDTERMDRFIRA